MTNDVSIYLMICNHVDDDVTMIMIKITKISIVILILIASK